MALNVVSSDRLSTNVKTSNLATGLSGKVGSSKNLLINGAMRVAQRGTATGANSSGYKALDRYRHTISIGTWTISKSTDSPDGFGSSLKMDCTTAAASPAAASALAIVQKIEGQNLQQLKKGTSSAEKVTFSFWIKCTKTGIAAVNLIDEDNTRMIGQQFTVSSANTWEKKTLTFAGDTAGALGNDNGSSLRVEIWLDAGSDYKSGATPTSWETLASTDYFVGGTLNLGDNTSNDVYITGLQLELGDTATEFERTSYGNELAECQRYYEGIYMTDGTAMMKGYAASGGSSNFEYEFAVEKRARPTWSLEGNAAWSGATPNAYESTTSCLFQVNAGTLFSLGDAADDLCGSFSAEL